MDPESSELSIWNRPLHSSEDIIACLEWLIPYTMELEKRVAKYESQQVLSPRKLEYRIGKLFIKELSGTLNIGITSIDKDTNLTDLSALSEAELSDDSNGVREESWYREEGWFGEPQNFED